MGEGWHNNHHAYPPAAVFGMKWWQVDVGGSLLRALEKLGWARDLSSAPSGLLDTKRLSPQEMASPGRKR
jgi:stearoyl-CoA desaturase (delta-9 desaturase)